MIRLGPGAGATRPPSGTSLTRVTEPPLGVAEIVKKTHAGRLKAVPAVEEALARIAERDPDLNAFSVVRREEAVKEAKSVDRKLKADRGPLHGVPDRDQGGARRRRGA